MSEEASSGFSPSVCVATGLGVGLVLPAPGTFGALWGVPWAWAVLTCPQPWVGWASVLIGLVLGVPLCDAAARRLGMKDPGPVVWDEIATVPLVFLFVGDLGPWWWLAVGFGLHRVFDISKPWPCNRLEKLPGGWGIMADDVVAGLYGAVAMLLIRWAAGY
ncbi:Phosphatidylglycerophosphatase A [Posidoniimonas corsicana]|uniref:Phosphatidylglycerophosphatase A n=1 Tax=Posidoniimonas corsicana TaxID=1938618 RepID=A0A5C5VJ00_9BACT|nr:phosphatidylglycerophosphatase A [Posidoniimonas corsicana]TWT37869.1 Phosphatidylglycerophosphatase A [Posidoniimonas corsicana]